MRQLNKIFAMLLPVILLSMGLDYIDHGHLGGYNFWKWLFIGLILGLGKVGYEEYFKKEEDKK